MNFRVQDLLFSGVLFRDHGGEGWRITGPADTSQRRIRFGFVLACFFQRAGGLRFLKHDFQAGVGVRRSVHAGTLAVGLI